MEKLHSTSSDEESNGTDDEKTNLVGEKQPEDEDDELHQPSRIRQCLMIALVLLLEFTILCTETFLYPFFPQIAETKGLTKTQVGLIFSSYEIARFGTCLTTGVMMGRFSCKKLITFGGGLSALACLAFGLLYYTDGPVYFALCVIVRLCAGSGAGVFTVVSSTVLLKSTEFPAGTIVGAIEMMRGGGYVIGPAVGSALYQLTGFMCSFLLFGGIISVLTVAQMFVIPSVIESSTTPSKGFLPLLKIPGLLLLFVHSYFTHLGSSARVTLSGAYIYSELHQSTLTVGLLYSVWSTLYLLGCPIVSVIVNKGYLYSPMIVGWSIVSVTYLFMGPSQLLNFIFHGKKIFWLTVVTQSITHSTTSTLYIPPLKAAINLAEVNGFERDSLQTYGMMTGLINCAHALGYMTGPVIAGAIAEELDFTWVTTILAFSNLTMLVAMVIWLLWMKVTGQPIKPV